MSPTARSLKLLRSWGFACDVVERFIHAIQRRRDFLQIGDIIGAHPDHGFLMIQSTSGGNVSARVKKAQGTAALATWLKAGGRFEVHGWERANGSWRCRRVNVKADTLEPVEMTGPRSRTTKRQGSLFDA